MSILDRFNKKSKNGHNPATCSIDCNDCNITSIHNIRVGRRNNKKEGYHRLSKCTSIQLKEMMEILRFNKLTNRLNSQKSHKSTQDKIDKVERNTTLIEAKIREIKTEAKLKEYQESNIMKFPHMIYKPEFTNKDGKAKLEFNKIPISVNTTAYRALHHHYNNDTQNKFIL